MLQRMRHRRVTQIAGDSAWATYAKARAKVRAAHEAEEQRTPKQGSAVDQRGALECGVGFRQLRTCRRTRPGQLCAMFRPYARGNASTSSGGGSDY